MIKEAQAYANGILPVAQGNAARAVQEAEAYKSQVVLAWPPATRSRFSQLALAYDKAPAVTRERLYIETVESVLKSSRKVHHRFEERQRQHALPTARQAHGSQSRIGCQHGHGAAAGERSSRIRAPAPDSRQRVER